MWFEIQSKSFPKKLIWNQSKSLKKWFKIPILIVAIENRQFTECAYVVVIRGVERTMYDFHNSTDTLKFWTEKRAINKTFFVFHLILMKLGEVVVIHVYYNFTKFHQNRMKNKKKSFINSPFQSVSRIVKIVRSANETPPPPLKKNLYGRIHLPLNKTLMEL